MNVGKKPIALEAISYLKANGLAIEQGWHLNGEPPSDVAGYLGGMIEGCLPADEDELAQQVIGMIEMELKERT